MRRRKPLAGDEQDLIRDLYPSLRRFAAVVGSAEIDPDDLVQDALLRALRHGPLTDLTYPTAYLRKCMVNLSKDGRRSLGRRRKALVALAATSGAFVQDYPSDVAELLALPAKTRVIIYLKEVEGRSFAEIADLVGCSETAARSAASRGRKRLQRLFSEEVRDATA